MTRTRADGANLTRPAAEPTEGRRNPPTLKGRRTREGLIRSARNVFERDGFLKARITDMARGAHISHGSFYSYFDSKEDIFWAVLNEVTADMFGERSPTPPTSPPRRRRDDRRPDDVAKNIEAGNAAFIESFRRNAAMICVLEEVATYNLEFKHHRREVRHRFIERTERWLRRQRANGLVGEGVDPYYTAHALGAMMDRFCYAWFVLEEDFDEERAVSELNRIWFAALGVEKR